MEINLCNHDGFSSESVPRIDSLLNNFKITLNRRNIIFLYRYLFSLYITPRKEVFWLTVCKELIRQIFIIVVLNCYKWCKEETEEFFREILVKALAAGTSFLFHKL